ncbi:alpha/beta hydrolase, partial [Accumulibacter sp.]|uniref:alpha/beta hydrolase n=1 Tax=Accumulibacter sp. TaxID=2053492 RepID=UPI001AC684F4
MIGERPLPAPAGILAPPVGDRVVPWHNALGWLRAFGSLAALAGLAYLVLLAWIYHHQERLIFRPAPLPATHRFALADVHEVAIPVAGATLSALHLRLPNPRGLIFFLHGNSGNAADWLTSTDFYRAANYDLLLLDYRGYGKSGGRIESEEQLRADVRAAWQAVAPAYAGRRTVIYGRSLGTALAAGL